MKLKEIYHQEKMFRILQGDVGSGKLFVPLYQFQIQLSLVINVHLWHLPIF